MEAWGGFLLLPLLLIPAACEPAPSPTAPTGPVARTVIPPPDPTLPPISPEGGFDGELIPVLELLEPSAAGTRTFGGAVASLGDVDGDGVGDLAVADPGADRVHVFSGDSRLRLYSVGDPDGESGYFFGNALVGVGDVDGDGRSDLAVGAMGDPAALPIPDAGCIPQPNDPCPDEAPLNPTTGRAFLFSGADGSLLRSLRPDRPVFTFGMRLAAPGDVDGDGIPDVTASAPFAPGGAPGIGRVITFSGADGDPIWSRRDPPSCSPDPTPACGLDFASYGMGLAAVSDLDGDGIRDLLVGDPFNASFSDGPDFRDEEQGARVTALSGVTGSVLRIHEDPGEETGYGGALAPTGVVPEEGSGGTGGTASNIDHVVGIPASAALDLFDAAGGVHLRRIGTPGGGSDDSFSATLAPGDDFDGDGRDDFWVGAAGSGTIYLLNPFGEVLLSVSGLGTGVPVPLTHTLQIAPTPNLGLDGRRDLLIGDGADNAAYVLEVETPASLLQEELARIADLSGQGVLNVGQANSLTSKVRVSLKGAEDGNPRQAAQPLGALVNEVTAYERADVLDEDEASSLIEPADLVRTWIRASF